ncbi:MAG: hypothetical protein HYV42_01480 [Candidatus Magasanikbacteria bacterium]|nr:hypothetical protein [Candidatus Magasanikbacteria bacterium]
MEKQLLLAGTPALVYKGAQEFFDKTSLLESDSLNLVIKVENADGARTEMITASGTMLPLIIAVLVNRLEEVALETNITKLVVDVTVCEHALAEDAGAAQPSDCLDIALATLGDIPDQESAVRFIRERLKPIVGRSRATMCGFAREAGISTGYLTQILRSQKTPSGGVILQILGVIHALSRPSVTKPFRLLLTKQDWNLLWALTQKTPTEDKK